MHYVYCAVRTGYLNVIQVNFSLWKVNIYLFMLTLIGLHSAYKNSNGRSEFTLRKVSVSTVVSPTFYHRTNPFGDRHGGIPPQIFVFIHRAPGYTGILKVLLACVRATLTFACVHSMFTARIWSFCLPLLFPSIKHRSFLPHILTTDRQSA